MLEKQRYNDVVVFEDGAIRINVAVDFNKDTVWLTQKQMSELFNTSSDNIGLHIKNIYEEGELDLSTTEDFSVVQKEGKRSIKRSLKHYNLDMIISVGYRVKSQRGIQFRKWATGILKDFMIQGYAINEKRLSALNKTVQIQSGIIAGMAGIDAASVLEVVEEYTSALALLDDYDHQRMEKPKGRKGTYQLTYEECRHLIDSMRFNSDVFGIEKEKGKVEGILAAVYQEVFGQDMYPSLEEKAVNLLYFMIKDHPFADGCKRISATLFLEYLNKNDALLNNGQKIISDSALVAITLMVAESKPEEKEIIVALIMNFLQQ